MVIPASRIDFNPIVRALGALIEEDADGPKRLVRAVLYLWQKAQYPLLVTRAGDGLALDRRWLFGGRKIIQKAARTCATEDAD